MSDFDDRFAEAGRPALLDTFGESVTYTPAGESGQSITVIVDRDAYEEELAEDGREVVKRARISVSAADITPAINDSITLDSLSFDVESIEGPEGGMFDLVVTRPVSTARSHGDNRIRRG